MKQFAVGSLVVLVTACGSNGSPSSPSPAQPTTVVFTAALNASNEVPPVTNAESNGRGTGTFTLNLTRDGSGNITDATGTFSYSLTGFPAGSQVRLTHIHQGPPSATGGVVIDSGLTAANAITLADGTLANQTFSNRPVGAALAQQIMADPNGFYFNVHTALNPGGAVRAQLVRQ